MIKDQKNKGGQMRYYQIIKGMSSKFNHRLKMIEYALQHGISQAAKEYQTIRKTVRK